MNGFGALSETAPSVPASPMKASVLIPVKNGGPLLGDVLDAVLAQSTPWPFEVIVMDSGSTDGSVALARARGVRVESVAPADFGHGRTRNQLASISIGEFLVFITQDAKPASRHWLDALVQACDAEPSVACAFGPHRAYSHARLVTRKELDQHFAGFGERLSVARLDDATRFEHDLGYRQFLHFFSNNNSCLRRSVWAQLPFPDVMFAEDQTWALQAIRAGYGKAFAPDAAVFHSHDFGVWETLQRNFDEARSFRLYFGYRMQPGLFGTLRTALALARRDRAWLRDDGGLRGWALWRAASYMAAVELARVVGQYLGTASEQLPRWLPAMISRDQGLQRKGAA